MSSQLTGTFSLFKFANMMLFLPASILILLG